MDFDTHLTRLDAEADVRVGNTFEFSDDRGVTWEPLKAFLLMFSAEEQPDLADLDALNHENRVKVNKALIALPNDDHRFKHPKLGAISWKVENWVEVENGRYWLIDLQKA